MLSRLTVVAIIILVILGAIFFLVRPFRTSSTNIKTLTINSDGNFDSEKISLSNDERLKIKNEDDETHTVKNSGSDADLVVVEPNQTSKELEFANDSNNTIYLSDKTEEKALVVVGSPSAEEAVTIDEEPTDTTTTTPTRNNGGEPLPNTGPEFNFLYPILTGLGLLLLRYKKI